MSTPENFESVVSRLDAIATRWSLIQQAHPGAISDDAKAARQALVLRYARSIRRYVGSMVQKASDADELSQDVLLRLMQGDFGGAEPNRGRFRDLLKTAVRNMVRNYWAKTRKTAVVDLELLPQPELDDPAWTAEWQANVLELTWQAMRQLEKEHPGKLTYTVLKLRTDHADASSDELAATLSEQVGTLVKPDTFRQMLRRARLRFAEALVTEVGVSLADPTPQRVIEELAALGLLEYVKDFGVV